MRPVLVFILFSILGAFLACMALYAIFTGMAADSPGLIAPADYVRAHSRQIGVTFMAAGSVALAMSIWVRQFRIVLAAVAGCALLMTFVLPPMPVGSTGGRSEFALRMVYMFSVFAGAMLACAFVRRFGLLLPEPTKADS